MVEQGKLGWSAVGWALVMAAACRPGEEINDTLPEMVDSAGVELVTYRGGLRGEPLALQSVWTHGFGDDDYLFQSVYSGALGLDGSAVLGEAGNQEIVHVGAQGSDYTVWATSGEGPGEMKMIRAVRRAVTDGFWVEDTGNWRITRFVQGSAAQIVSIATNHLFYFMPLGVDGRGRLLLSTAAYIPGFGQEWLEGHMVRFEPDGGVLDTLGTYPLVSRQPETGANPFAARGTITATDEGFIHARQDIPELIWRDGEGGIKRVVRWVAEETFPTASTWQGFIEALAVDLARMNPGLSGGQLERAAQATAANWEMDESIPLPLFGSMYGAPNGDVWLADFAPWSAWPQDFTVVSSDGSEVRRVRVGRAFKVLDILDDLVLGIHRNELDVQGVTVYRIVKTDGPT